MEEMKEINSQSHRMIEFSKFTTLLTVLVSRFVALVKKQNVGSLSRMINPHEEELVIKLLLFCITDGIIYKQIVLYFFHANPQFLSNPTLSVY